MRAKTKQAMQYTSLLYDTLCLTSNCTHLWVRIRNTAWTRQRHAQTCSRHNKPTVRHQTSISLCTTLPDWAVAGNSHSIALTAQPSTVHLQHSKTAYQHGRDPRRKFSSQPTNSVASAVPIPPKSDTSGQCNHSSKRNVSEASSANKTLFLAQLAVDFLIRATHAIFDTPSNLKPAPVYERDHQTPQAWNS
jgi:hypothetical protein